MPYTMVIQMASSASYLYNALTILESDWSPCYKGLMIYSPISSVSDRDIEEPCDLQKLVSIIKEKALIGEEIEFLATHPGLKFCCNFMFSPDNSVVVVLSGEEFFQSDILSIPDFNFYFRTVIKLFINVGREVLSYSFEYQR